MSDRHIHEAMEGSNPWGGSVSDDSMRWSPPQEAQPKPLPPVSRPDPLRVAVVVQSAAGVSVYHLRSPSDLSVDLSCEEDERTRDFYLRPHYLAGPVSLETRFTFSAKVDQRGFDRFDGRSAVAMVLSNIVQEMG